MQLVRTDRSFPFSLLANGSVATIGTFDGVHLGHQYLLKRVLAEAVARNLPSVVMSFEPTPKEYFSSGNPPTRLASFREKFETFRKMGFDIFYCPRFGDEMRSIAADTFIRRLLIHAMNVRHLVVGDDFEFARNREGTLEELKRVSGPLGFSVEHVASILAGKERISSTAIRGLLREGDLAGARRLLGRRYRMSGRVIDREGSSRVDHKDVAFLNMRRRRCAVNGVFAVMVHGVGDKPLGGIASVSNGGIDGDTQRKIAVLVLDPSEAPGSAHVDVEFIERISSDAVSGRGVPLLQEMQRHEKKARNILATI